MMGSMGFHNIKIRSFIRKVECLYKKINKGGDGVFIEVSYLQKRIYVNGKMLKMHKYFYNVVRDTDYREGDEDEGLVVFEMIYLVIRYVFC